MTKGLTDRQCTLAEPSEREYLLGDGHGLSLRVRPNGRKDWVWRYSDDAGIRRKLGLGAYPLVPLVDARAKAREKSKLLAAGQDPKAAIIEHKREARRQAFATFEAVARAWHAHAKVVEEWSESYSVKILRMMELHAFPQLGGMPIGSIQQIDVYNTLSRCSAGGTRETALRLRESIARAFRYAVTQGLIEPHSNFMAPGVSDMKLPAPRVRHHAALLDPDRVGQLMRDIRGYEGNPITRGLLLLMPLLFQRPGALRRMRWDQIDDEARMWVCPPEIMKMREASRADARPHLVPLSRQAWAVLEELKKVTGGDGFVFPSVSRRRRRDGTYSRVISENTANAALRSLGYDTQEEVSGHGFRAMARTMLKERLGWSREVIERHLAHGSEEVLGEAYDRTTFFEQRCEMVQRWADYLDELDELARGGLAGGVLKIVKGAA